MSNLKYIFLFTFLFAVFTSNAQSFNGKENAVYIFNFIRNTEFPNRPADLTIGILGNTTVENELKILLQKKGSSYTIKRITLADAKNVNIIIIAGSSSKHLKEINKATAKLPILIITEKPDLNYSGACISLFMDDEDDNKTKYQLSPFNLRSRGLVVSSQIISNAVLVR